MLRKDESMKVLEIIDNHGWYILNGEKKSILDLNKEDIFLILEAVYSNDEIQNDVIDDRHNILNDAEKVIYDNIYKYILEFEQKKSNLKKEIDEEFSDIIQLLDSDEEK